MAKCCDAAKKNRQHRITFEAPDTTPDSSGQFDRWGSPTEIATTSACIEPISGGEFMWAQQTEARISHRVTLRYHTGIKPEQRIKWASADRGTVYFNIRFIRNLEEQNQWLEIMAEEGVAV